MTNQNNETHNANMQTPVDQIAGAFPNHGLVTPPNQIIHTPTTPPAAPEHPQQPAPHQSANPAARRVLFLPTTITFDPHCGQDIPKNPWDMDRDFDPDGSAGGCIVGVAPDAMACAA